MPGPDDGAAAVLSIDLTAIAANYRLLAARLGPAPDCAAVVKADAYGLGVAAVAPTLHDAGCRIFFVATLDEGIELRGLLPEAEIYAFNGLAAGGAEAFLAHALRPVLNSLGEIDAWAAMGRRRGPAPAALHIDTGMARLGLPPAELAVLAEDRARLDGVTLALVLSHLACADEGAHPMNARQLAAFRDAARRVAPAGVRLSLAASAGIFLGADYCFHVARPGAALYGLRPRPDAPNPLAPVVRLQGKILQVRDVDSDTTVGYGATHRVTGPARLATVGAGYADGYLRSLSNRGSAHIGAERVPVVGRVSMDLITLDVTAIAPERVAPGALVDLIGPHNPADALAEEAGTIGYEILTSLGRRYRRHYVGGAAPTAGG
ncbi:MAG: alanine racemase [Dongiaceae bacterium]